MEGAQDLTALINQVNKLKFEVDNETVRRHMQANKEMYFSKDGQDEKEVKILEKLSCALECLNCQNIPFEGFSCKKCMGIYCGKCSL